MNQDGRDDYKKPMNRRNTVACLAKATGLSKEQIEGVFDALVGLARKNLNEGRGEFTIPGLLKLKVVRRPATEERSGIHYVTKQSAVSKAMPAHNVIIVLSSKALRESVG
jgi:nucleoid DNA-binding protein